jgi:large subunit ribosomal protein L21
MTPSKFAVVKIKNNQYKLQEGDVVEIHKVAGEPGTKLNFDEVLLSVDGDKVEVGTPLVAKSSVSAEIVEQTKGDKVTTFKFKSKSRYRRKVGHRQQLTMIKVNKIS